MLNELIDLNNSLSKAGIALKPWDTDYRTCPKGSITIMLFLNQDGSIVDIEPITDRKRRQSFRKWEPANGESFPSFNVCPFWQPYSDTANEAVKNFKNDFVKFLSQKNKNVLDLIENVENECEDLWSEKRLKKFEKCFKRAKELGKIIGVFSEEDKSFETLIERTTQLTSQSFKSNFYAVVKNKMLSNEDLFEEYCSLFVSTSKNPENISLIFELSDRTSFTYPANHTEVQRRVNDKLIAYKKQVYSQSKSIGCDAFGNVMTNSDMKTKLPKVRLPKLGDVILRAMNAESLCQKRYGKIDSKSFPIAKQSSSSMKDSLEWIIKDERRGKTWADISGICGYKNAILYAYPSIIPSIPIEIAQIIVRDDSGMQKESQFEAIASRVIEALTELKTQNLSLGVRVVALAKMDKARTKLLTSKNYSADNIISAAKEWNNASYYLPYINLNIGTDEKPIKVNHSSLFPSDVIQALNLKWVQDGRRSMSIRGLSLENGLSLFIDQADKKRFAASLGLHLFITNCSSLLIAAGHADHRRDGIFKVNKSTKQNLELLPQIVGVLLFKLKEKTNKEGFSMDNPAFLIGQILALSDLIHKGYCICVRDGGIPPRLLGNSLVAIALENPEKALVRLGEKLPIYTAWANTTKKSDISSLAKNFEEKRKALGIAQWALNQLGHISSQVALNVPQTTIDADKAQLILGYIARIKEDSEKV